VPRPPPAAGLLRSALEELREGGRLEELGVRLLPSPVWHPLRPEQKRGRDATAATRRLLAASCAPPPPLPAPAPAPAAAVCPGRRRSGV
jgi:hypothetical protein